MKIYTGDEMFSDAFPLKDFDDMLYEVTAEMITVKDGPIDIGANASAEEAEEGVDDAEIRDINVKLAFKLQEAPKFSDKKEFMNALKAYLKKVKGYLDEKNPERVAAFQAGAQNTVKMLVAKFEKNELDFYCGESMDPDAGMAYLDYKEDGVTPYFLFWKDGLKATKI